MIILHSISFTCTQEQTHLNPFTVLCMVRLRNPSFLFKFIGLWSCFSCLFYVFAKFMSFISLTNACYLICFLVCFSAIHYCLFLSLDFNWPDGARKRVKEEKKGWFYREWRRLWRLVGDFAKGINMFSKGIIVSS